MMHSRYDYLKLDRTIMGQPLAAAISDEAERRGASRVLVVMAGTLSRDTSILEDVKAALGDRFVDSYNRTVTHVPRDSAIELADTLRASETDLVLTIGGGTCIDSVKMALICLAEEVTSPDELEAFAIRVNDAGARYTPYIKPPPVRQVAAPTTLSGAEFSDLSGCVDASTQVKQLFSGSEIGPATVILDPAITVHTPADLWLSTGVRAIDHAVETVCSTEAMPFTDAGALHAIRLLGKSLGVNYSDPGDLEARLDSQVAVSLACTGLNRVAYGASHGIGHQLGAVAGVPHGYTSCILLPHVMAYNLSASASQQQLISEALGHPGRSASELIAEIIAALGMPTRLRDVGVRRDHFPAIAQGSLLNAWVRANPAPISTAAQVVEILDAAF